MKYPELLLLTGLMVGGLVYAENQDGGGGRRPPQMDAATKAKFEACATEAGMPARDSGTLPTKEQHEAFKACLAKAGVSMPEHRGHRHGGGKPDDGGAPPDESQSGGSN
ncbi:MAG: hypothetical protein ACXVAX_10015 [Pseudobdellovibrio sp.]